MDKPKPNNRLRKTIDHVTSPLQKFLQLEASSGVVLLFIAVLAMLFANSSWSELYFSFIQTPVDIKVGGFELNKTLLLLVNDGLMAIFFYLVGLEIKRELMVGELSSPRKASFSFFAAMGGMLFPAAVYLGVNWGDSGVDGWGIPMATDIAFALGVVTLLGKRVPAALKVFLLALAIVDDLGAILIIALFYSGEIATHYLGFASMALFLLFVLNHAGFRNIALGIVLGTITWFCFLKSGVHATIAGVLLAFLTPAYVIDKNESERLLLDDYIHALHPWVAFFIMPVFAFFNAGVAIGGLNIGAILLGPVALGIILGLVVGKPLGIFAMAYLAVKMKWADLPKETNWGQVVAIGFVAGIGFTMSLFISSLAFSDPGIETSSKVGILVASIVAMAIGYLMLRFFTQNQSDEKL